MTGFIWIMRFFVEPFSFFWPAEDELFYSTTEAEFLPSAPASAAAPAPAPAPADAPTVFVWLVVAESEATAA